MAYRTYSTVNGFIVAQNGTGDFTSINAAISAINAASLSPSRIFLTDPIYNESFTVPNLCNISTNTSGANAYGSVINGKISFGVIGGSFTISNMRINNTSNDYCLSVSNGIARLQNVNMLGTNFDLIQVTGQGSVTMDGGLLNLNAANISLLQSSSSGSLLFKNVQFVNDGFSTKSSSVSNGVCFITFCTGVGVFTSSATGIVSIENSDINNVGINITPLTSGGTGDFVTNSFLQGGTQPVLTIASTCTISTCSLDSTAANIISGTGTLIYSDLTFTDSAKTLGAALTKTPLTTLIGTLHLNPLTFLAGSIPYASADGTISPLVKATDGDVLQLKSGFPAWSTPTFPVTVGGSGTILRSDGTNWSATTATYPNTSTINQLLYSSSANTIAGLATANSSILVTSAGGIPSLSGTLPFTVPVTTGGTGLATLTAHSIQVGNGTSNVTQLAVGATGTVLTGVTGADPAFSATPTLTSVTFGSGTALSVYQQGTWTPILNFGGLTTGITYAGQTGQYSQIGNMVFFSYIINLSSKGSATGAATITGLPVTSGGGNVAVHNMDAFSITYTALYTSVLAFINSGGTTISLSQNGSAQIPTSLLDTSFANNSRVYATGFYFTS